MPIESASMAPAMMPEELPAAACGAIAAVADGLMLSPADAAKLPTDPGEGSCAGDCADAAGPESSVGGADPR